MNRNLAAAVVVGVAGVTAAVVFLLSPGTGPDIGPAPEPLPAAPPPADVAVRAAPSPRPTSPPPARVRPERPQAFGVRTPGPGFDGRVGARGGFEGRRAAPPLRDRYTERGHERLVGAMQAVAADQGWGDDQLAEVMTVLESGRKQGLQVLQAHGAEDGDRAKLAHDLLQVRQEEQQALEGLLGADAEGILRKSGYLGRKPRGRKPR